MTHRERFYRIANHQQADRAVFDLAGSPQTAIDHPETHRALMRLLGFEGEKQGPYNVDERILERFDIDLRRIGGMPIPRTSHVRTENGVTYDEFGIGYRPVNGHSEICFNPLRDADMDEVLSYELPDPEKIDLRQIDAWAAQAQTQAVIPAAPGISIDSVDTAWGRRSASDTAIITPAEKPRMGESTLGAGFLKNATVAAPRAVSSHVPTVASVARSTFCIKIPPHYSISRRKIFVYKPLKM